MNSVEIENGKILINAKPVQIVSGAMHYFRVHPELWEDRLDKAVAMGLNTIESYTCWNLHEPSPGVFDFSGILDLERYIRCVQARGLYMILRPGPFICAEFENGGFPAWVTALLGVRLRQMNEPYLTAVKRYFKVLLERIRPYLHTNGGPVILMQIENEYGAYGHDHAYLQELRKLYEACGVDIPLFTSDGPAPYMVLGGTIPEAAMTLNFGSRSAEAWQLGRKYRPNGPDFCMEFWNGWFDHWGEKHHVRSPGMEEGGAGFELDRMLAAGANVNLYMFHGGTNFGFTAGANGHFRNDYAPTVTSYDYDCPLSECGDPTPKFEIFQKIIRKHTGNSRIQSIQPTEKVVPTPVLLTEAASLLDNLEQISEKSGYAVNPPTMEAIGQEMGFIHYSTTIEGPIPEADLRLVEVNDYAQVWLNGQYLGSRMRDWGDHPLTAFAITEKTGRLDVLVENCGRINYGPFVGRDFKGILNAVTWGLQLRWNWQFHSLPLKSLTGLRFLPRQNVSGKAGIFYRGFFELDKTGDAFLIRPGRKGVVWINGFNLGRYWERGPQETLYVPAPVLRCGANEIVVLEQEELLTEAVQFSPVHQLGVIS